MAKRYVYLPLSVAPFYEVKEIEFKWEPGMSLSQKKKSSENLRESSANLLGKQNGDCFLECSRAGETVLGSKLSAFNLPYFLEPNITVESAYQGSKVFKSKTTGEVISLEYLFNATSMEAKQDPHLQDYNLELIYFADRQGNKYPANPRNIYYDYMYINSLKNQLSKREQEELTEYAGFTDIMLRWYGKVTSCQAMSVAIFVGLLMSNNLHHTDTYEDFRKLCLLDEFTNQQVSEQIKFV